MPVQIEEQVRPFEEAQRRLQTIPGRDKPQHGIRCPVNEQGWKFWARPQVVAA